MKKIAIKLLSTVAAFLLMSSIISALPTNAVDTETKLIALTFDDGPNTTTTNDVLDVLEKYDAKASFFLIGNNINAESAVSVKRAYDMGMEIDNHSKTHSNMSKMSADELQAEISDVDEKVKEITGEETKFSDLRLLMLAKVCMITFRTHLSAELIQGIIWKIYLHRNVLITF